MGLLNDLAASTITLFQHTSSTVDAFNNPVYTDTEYSVPGCLVNVTGFSESISSDNYKGRKQTIEIDVPKDDTHTWEDGKVVWHGHTYRIIGPAGESDCTPLEWNKRYIAERYE